ncbi:MULTISPECIES: alkaline phosphatase [Ralstonia]|uniref:alkaline phosphatase n=1 Tax=Ralstonia TaxID=48736 RepID=UPI0005D9DB29|nr:MULTISPECIES: alkaline phosphatase [Ralstonia]AJW43782.1 alkaline phosphatase [Ralstonia mannitolilytica]MBU9579819.1 alkaline phosphatase [Ralstonia mannitolilytica]PLT16242.1 alkaline phosphatase [Ralstonia mannitolilytica]QIF09019.1 alkaline phosphatase [Ralstonia mannitolilytica]CAJ0728476.1 Alkaline phosphatase [Ralstonia mannitolilytica]
MNTQSNRIVRAALLALAAGACAQAHAAGEAKNVIFFLGDGMGPTTVTATRIYKVGEAGRLTMETLKRTARIKTYSNDAQTTDSAPSMSAYMTGVKMNNEVISMSQDTKASDATGKGYVSGADSTCPAGNGTPAVTLLELAKAAGKSVGAVTTTRLTHATPAATYSHICHRDGENQIAAQGTPGNALYNTALKDGVDVLLGGGRRHYVPQTTAGSKRTDTTDLIAQFQTAGYSYVSTGTQLAAVDPASTNKLLGLFNMDHMNYELDRVKKAIDEPSLADMTEKAIRVLQKNGKGYFLMVEGGRIDHALHGTNAKRALEDAGAFDEAIKRALSIADLQNTLIVVTADHDHTMTINGYPRKGNPILGVSNDIKTGQPQLAADGLPYTTLVFGNGGTPRKATRDNVAAIDTTADDYLQEVGVQLGTPGSETHGGGDVMLFSSGPGSAPLKGTLDNTKVFGVVKTAMGL